MSPIFTLKQRVSQISIVTFIVTSIVVITSFTLYSMKKAKIAEGFVQKELNQNIKEQLDLFVPSFMLPEHMRGLDILLERIKKNEKLEGAFLIRNENELPSNFSSCVLKHTVPTYCSSTDMKSSAVIHPLIEDKDHYGFLFKSKKNISPSSIKDIIEVTVLIISVFAFVFAAIYLSIIRLLSRTLPDALDELVKWIESDLQGVKIDINLPFKELEDLRLKISEVLEAYNKSTKKTLKYELSRQLVHDIRNPLETIESIVSQNDNNSLTPRETQLIVDCTARIGQLSNSLLFMEKPSTELCNDFDILKTIKSCIEQRSTSLSSRKVSIVLNVDKNLREVIVKGKELDFYRTINNILKNSCESFESDSGQIIVRCKLEESSVHVQVIDFGCGISQGVLTRINEGGYTNKISGNGLGLIQVRETVNAMNGTFLIESCIGKGTTISLKFPYDSIKKIKEYILIDDDKFIRSNWMIQAEKNKVELKCYENVSDFVLDHQSISRNSIVCIDSCLSNGIKGELAAEEIFNLGFNQICLSTSMRDIDISKFPWIEKVVSKRPLFIN